MPAAPFTMLDHTLGKLRGFWSSGMSSDAVKTARALGSRMSSVGSSVGKDMKSWGGASRIAASATAGGGAGYLASDDRDKLSGTIKGFGLGAIAGAGWVAARNPALRAEANAGWGAAKSEMAARGIDGGMLARAKNRESAMARRTFRGSQTIPNTQGPASDLVAHRRMANWKARV
jgi:hypothetical protein